MMNDLIKEAFENVHAEEDVKKNTVDYVIGKMRNKEKGIILFRRVVTICVCAIVISAVCVGLGIYYTPVYSISIDVNPSLEISINSFNRVLEVKGYNDDGNNLSESIDIKNMEYIDAINSLLDNKIINSYTENGETVYITVTGKNEKKSERVLSKVTEATKNCNVSCQSGKREEEKKAHSEGISVGKYKMLLQLNEYDNSITADDIRNMPIKQIKEWLSDLKESHKGK